jgi:glycosyltransferase involved in cell wall biosynthesis
MKLLLFFTYGVSLKTWKDTGILNREIELYRKLNDRGIEISFFTYGDKTDITICNELDFTIKVFPLYDFKNKQRYKFLDVINTLLIITNNKIHFDYFDFYKSNQFWGSWLALYCKWLYKGKFILRCGFEYNNNIAAHSRSLFFRFLVYIFSLFLYRKSDAIIVTSPVDKQFIIKRFLFLSNIQKVVVIPNLINTDKFKFFYKPTLGDVLVIARLESQKNVELAINVCSKLNLSLTIIGNGSLQKRICCLANSQIKNFVYYDSIDNDHIPDLINSHRIYLSTSKYEGNPKSLLEAMSSEAIVIVRNSPGNNSIIKHNINGFMFSTESELFSILHKLSHASPSYSEMRFKAREYVLNQHSINVISDIEYSLLVQLNGMK